MMIIIVILAIIFIPTHIKQLCLCVCASFMNFKCIDLADLTNRIRSTALFN